ncbi:MAG: type II toxin-antitoxin system Phd/YefM family antitoxin [Bacillota bacterium]
MVGAENCTEFCTEGWRPRAITRTIPATEARQLFLQLLDWVNQAKDRVVITKHGRPVAVILSYDQYEQLITTAEVLRSASHDATRGGH